MRRPSFFIVGGPKCGTTGLFRYLGEHQRIFVPRVKEPHYFANDLLRWPLVSDLDDYLALFRGARGQHLAVGEASVFYLFSPDAIGRIRQFNPDARIIVMVRNPVEMAHSLHSQLLHSCNEDVAEFAGAWRLQERRRQGDRIPPTCRMPSALQYAAVCSLGEQLQRLLQVFPRDQVHVVVFDDLRRDTADVYRAALGFLGVPDDGRTAFGRVNTNKVARWPRLNRWVRRPPPGLARALGLAREAMGGVGTGLGARLLALNARHRPRAPLPREMWAELRQAFAQDVEQLSSLLGRDLSYWTEP